MIDSQEHIYHDDPSRFHADARTRPDGISYFFLGNGHIQAAVQISSSGQQSPIGVLIMNPEIPGKKRDSLTFDPETGLQNTMLRLRSENRTETPEPSFIEAHWCHECRFPTAHVQWNTEACRVIEHFFCPDRNRAVLAREIRIHNITHQTLTLHAETSVPGKAVSVPLNLMPDEQCRVYLRYQLFPEKHALSLDHVHEEHLTRDLHDYWESTSQISFHSLILDHFFNASRYQLPVMISRSGKMDGSIWQYNREWVRDQAMAVVGLCQSGHFRIAGRMLRRLFREFVSPEGATMDSSMSRSHEESELDQNGALLYACAQYAAWTGEDEVVRTFWPLIKKLAQFPLSRTFRHESGLLANAREYWERHALYGIEKGFEAAHHIWMILGLRAASELALMMDDRNFSRRWDLEARAIHKQLLHEGPYGFVHQGALIKRLGLNGRIQETIDPPSEGFLPAESPLSGTGPHYLNPDTSVALAVAEGLIQPDSSLARKTMQTMEVLWDQDWHGGGYGRYHIRSEPDSPGAWSFPSLFVARAYLEMKEYHKVYRILRWLGQTPGAQSGSWFENYGPRLSPPFPQVGITPWTWAEMIALLVHHLLGFRPQADHFRLRPRLLPDVEQIEASLPLRGHRVHVHIQQSRSGGKHRFHTEETILEQGEDFICIPYPNHDCRVDVQI